MSCARSEPPGARTLAPAAPRGIGIASSTHNADVSSTSTSNGNTANNSAAALSSSRGAALSIPASTGMAPDAGIAAAEPQTDELPSGDNQSFVERVNLLCSAIIEGRPELAHGAFFPMAAYRQVKAVADPDRDYKIRLLSHFDRDIAEYHRRIASPHHPIHCSGFRLPKGQARWMKPGSEYNRIGYYRVLRSQLDLTDTDGNTTTLEVTSLISWRGQWFVVHLHGFE